MIHRGKEWISIHLPYDAALQTHIRAVQEIRWSQTHKCWYTPLSPHFLTAIHAVCKDTAIVDDRLVSAYLQYQQRSPRLAKSLLSARPDTGLYATISRENFEALLKTEQCLVLKAYSPSTIATYLNEIRVFMKAIKQIPAANFTTDRVKDYLQYCARELQLSENTLHSRMNALKFCYEQVLGREKFFLEIPRPKKPLQLPHFFNQGEIVAIIKAAGNLKHRVMLMLAYSAGLRVSEVVVLTTQAIDSSRMCMIIKRAKGKKDRIVMLSPVILVMLREYARVYRPPKNGYLFPGQTKEKPYSTRKG